MNTNSSTIPESLSCRKMFSKSPSSADDKNQFSYLTYNVLADCYANPMYCKNWKDADWSFRRERLLKEIEHLDADVVGLQEVDHYEDFWKLVLQSKYHALYHRRNCSRGDGSALFFKKTRFEVLEFSGICMNEIAILDDSFDEETDKKIKNKDSVNVDTFFLRDSVGLVALLKDKQNGRYLCCCNVHLYWDPKLEEIKLAQTHFTLVMAHHLMQKWAKKHNIPFQNIAFTLNGDFNSQPDSRVYDFITSNKHVKTPQKQLKSHQPNIVNILKSEREFSALFAETTIPITNSKPFIKTGINLSPDVNCFGNCLESGVFAVAGKEPSFTNADKNATYTLDYIFFEEKSLKATAYLELPAQEYVALGSSKRPVSEVFPSDHFPVLVKFAWK